MGIENKVKKNPALVVFSSLFPSPVSPGAGLFIRERMFRVGKEIQITVISPQPWFPLQGLIRYVMPNYRPMPPKSLEQDGVTIYYPRFFSFPMIFRWLDGYSMAMASYRLVKNLYRKNLVDIIDAHFAYPDGFAAVQIGKWFKLPTTITLRGTEPRISEHFIRGKLQRKAMLNASKLFSVSESLRNIALSHGVNSDRVITVGNGVDLDKFHPIPQNKAREELNIPMGEPILVSVGGLVERKGFHRVIELLPDLQCNGKRAHLLIVGGASSEGDWSDRLRDLVKKHGLETHVHFLGFQPPDKLKVILSAADIFVLATSNEGWANVFLEAMACGLPVITTDVGGNSEVIRDDKLGTIVPFGNKEALKNALQIALNRSWDKEYILRYASENTWDRRVDTLVSQFDALFR